MMMENNARVRQADPLPSKDGRPSCALCNRYDRYVARLSSLPLEERLGAWAFQAGEGWHGALHDRAQWFKPTPYSEWAPDVPAERSAMYREHYRYSCGVAVLDPMDGYWREITAACHLSCWRWPE